MAQMVYGNSAGSRPASPDVGTFLLLLAVLALLACTVYLIYLGCTYFGADTFFRAIYSPQRIPQITARLGEMGSAGLVGTAGRMLLAGF